ncbi:MAG TPA: twin-arginine translocase TatA/TatE family subunit [Patescibacteria group bacterium]|nr:twin-arginine translocase TatA/TatE family subunit [Patescibacteria group bacterium]
MFGIGTTEIIIIAGILVLLFGSKKIADLAGGVAEAVKILRGAFKDQGNQDNQDNKIEDKKN